jgi:uncharacterized protein YndB with AHSA1/START domain
MKRKVQLPLTPEQVFRAVHDPLLLSAWLDIPYAATGSHPPQLFELETWHTAHPWKFRGHIVETIPSKKVRIEKQEEKSIEAYRALVLLFEPTEEGCEMEVAWSSKKLDHLAKVFLDPEGHRRLAMVVDQHPKVEI